LVEIELMRSDLLVDSYRRIKPSILIIEYFPFAPRRFGKTTLNEPFNAIEKEQQRPIVVCSLRASPIVLPDIDADPASINEQLRNNFSCVLHHADPRFFPLTSLGPYMQTFPVEEFGDQLFQVSALHAQGMLLKGRANVKLLY
jgi:predicted glycosyltransferase